MPKKPNLAKAKSSGELRLESLGAAAGGGSVRTPSRSSGRRSRAGSRASADLAAASEVSLTPEPSTYYQTSIFGLRIGVYYLDGSAPSSKAASEVPASSRKSASGGRRSRAGAAKPEASAGPLSPGGTKFEPESSGGREFHGTAHHQVKLLGFDEEYFTTQLGIDVKPALNSAAAGILGKSFSQPRLQEMTVREGHGNPITNILRYVVSRRNFMLRVSEGIAHCLVDNKAPDAGHKKYALCSYNLLSGKSDSAFIRRAKIEGKSSKSLGITEEAKAEVLSVLQENAAFLSSLLDMSLHSFLESLRVPVPEGKKEKLEAICFKEVIDASCDFWGNRKNLDKSYKLLLGIQEAKSPKRYEEMLGAIHSLAATFGVATMYADRHFHDSGDGEEAEADELESSGELGSLVSSISPHQTLKIKTPTSSGRRSSAGRSRSRSDSRASSMSMGRASACEEDDEIDLIPIFRERVLDKILDPRALEIVKPISATSAKAAHRRDASSSSSSLTRPRSTSSFPTLAAEPASAEPKKVTEVKVTALASAPAAAAVPVAKKADAAPEENMFDMFDSTEAGGVAGAVGGSELYHEIDVRDLRACQLGRVLSAVHEDEGEVEDSPELKGAASAEAGMMVVDVAMPAAHLASAVCFSKEARALLADASTTSGAGGGGELVQPPASVAGEDSVEGYLEDILEEAAALAAAADEARPLAPKQKPTQ